MLVFILLVDVVNQGNMLVPPLPWLHLLEQPFMWWDSIPLDINFGNSINVNVFFHYKLFDYLVLWMACIQWPPPYVLKGNAEHIVFLGLAVHLPNLQGYEPVPQVPD